MQQRILEVNEKYDNKTKQISRELGTSESSMQNRITVLSTKLNGQIKNIQREQNETANKGKESLHSHFFLFKHLLYALNIEMFSISMFM